MREKNDIRIIVATGMAFAIIQLDGSAFNVLIATIASSLNQSLASSQWIITGYFVAFSSLLIASGAIADRIGIRKTFQIGVAIFCTANISAWIVTNWLIALIASRILQGLGAALMLPSSLALLNLYFHERPAARATAIGGWMAAGGGALAAGPVLGGVLLTYFEWSYLFIFLTILALFALTLLPPVSTISTHRNPSPSAAEHGFSWTAHLLGILTFVTMTSLLYNLVSLNLGSTLTLSCMGTICLISFLHRDKKTGGTVLYRFIKYCKAIHRDIFLGFFLNGAIYSLLLSLTLLAQQAWPTPPIQSSLAIVPYALVVCIANVAGGRLLIKHTSVRLISFTLAGSCLGLLFCAVFMGLGKPGDVILFSMPFSAMVGILVTAMTNHFVSGSPAGMEGISLGLLNAARQAGTAVGILLTSLCWEYYGSMGSATLLCLWTMSLIFMLSVYSIKKQRAAR